MKEFNFEEEMAELKKLLSSQNNRQINANQSNLSFGDLNNFFESRSFIDIIANAEFDHSNFNQTESVISNILFIATSYIEAFKDSPNASMDELKRIIKNFTSQSKGDIADLVESDVSYFVKNMITDKFLKDFNITSSSSNEEIQNVKSIVINRLSASNKYRAFNSFFLDEIKEFGLKPSFREAATEKDKDAIVAIFEKHNRLGYLPFNESDKDKVFYSLATFNSYDYSLTSPEWFSIFCGEGWRKRDYDLAKRKILDDCKTCNLSNEEKTIILNTFEKYWNLYNGHKQMLIAIPSDPLDLTKYAEFLPKQEPQTIVSFLLNEKIVNNNRYSKHIIPTKNAEIVELPSVQKVMEKVAEIDNKKELGVQ